MADEKANAMNDALLLSIFWALSRSALPLAEKVAALDYAAAMLRDHGAEAELAQLECWYGGGDVGNR